MSDAAAGKSEILIYQSEDGHSRIQVRLEDDTVWLTQALMAELFQTSIPNISMHIRNVFKEGELEPGSVVKDYLTTAADGKKYQTLFYNLDVILSVGYRVRSHCGTQFRRWATEHLRDYLVKGFAMDDERLKEGRTLGADYFDELLERIRDIRASEKRFYQKIRDIYKLSIDYDPADEATLEFFQIVQNKLHWAITGKTAAEIIAGRADVEKPNMGLTSWKGTKVRRGDVAIAKNYLDEKEVRICAKSSHAVNLAQRRFELGGFEFIGMNWVVDYPFRLKDRCRKDREVYVFQRQFGTGLLSNEKGFEELDDWPGHAASLPTIEDELKELPEPADPRKAVYVIHMPPAHLGLDVCQSGEQVGSEAVYRFIERMQPRLTLHGHIHESPARSGVWRAEVGETVCVQPGQLQGGMLSCVLIDLASMEMTRLVESIEQETRP